MSSFRDRNDRYGYNTGSYRRRGGIGTTITTVLLWLAVIFTAWIIIQEEFPSPRSDSQQGWSKADDSTTIQKTEQESASAESENRYFRRLLSKEHAAVYDSLLYGLQNHQATIEFELENKDDLSDIYDYVLWDYPELFWAYHGYVFSYYPEKGNRSMSVTPKYELTTEQAQQRIAFVEGKISNVTALYAGLSDYEKVKGVYEYLVNNTIYDSNYTDKTVYELFSEGRAVCGSYARAAQYILQRLGVEAIYTKGIATNSSGNTESHAWLKVLIDGEYYNVDVTWGDPVNEDGNQTLSHAYLCVTDADISTTHFPDNYPYPSCTATRCNYYTMENRLLSTYDKQLLTIWFSEDVAAGRKPEFRAMNDDVYRQTLSKLFDEDEYYDIAPQVPGLSTNSCSYSGNETMRVISISY